MNIDKNFDFFDSGLNKESFHKILSIQQMLDGFLFLVFDKSSKKIIQFTKYTTSPLNLFNQFSLTLKNILSEEKFSISDFYKIYYINPTQKSSLIPDFFSKQESEHLYRLSFEKESESVIIENHMPNWKSKCIFELNQMKYSFLQKELKNATILSNCYPFLSQLYKLQAQTHNNKHVYINAYSNFFDIAVIDHNKIMLFNSFKYQSPSDFLYFVLNIFEQLKLSYTQDHLHISQIYNSNDARIDLLKTYIQNIELNTKIIFDYNIDIPREVILDNYNFLNLILCE